MVGILGILGMLGIVMLSALGVLYLIGKTTQYQSDILIVAWVLFLVPVLCVVEVVKLLLANMRFAHLSYYTALAYCGF